jgi:hypothetical protein
MPVVKRFDEFEEGGGKFENFRGTVTEVYWTSFAYMGRPGEETRYEGFFLRYVITPEPGEDIDEPMTRYLSGGDLRFNLPGTGTGDMDFVNLEIGNTSDNDDKLRGFFAHTVGTRKFLMEGSNVDAFFAHLMGLESFDNDRLSHPDIRDSLLGLNAFWVTKSIERKFEKKSARYGKKDEDVSVSKILVPDGEIKFIPRDKLPTVGQSASGPSLDPAAQADAIKTILAKLVSGPMATDAVNNAIIATGASNMADMLQLSGSPSWLFSSDRPWATEGETIKLPG